MNSERIKKLKQMIEKSQAKLRESEQQLENIQNQKKSLKQAMDLSIKMQQNCGLPRIFTKEQLNALEKQKKNIEIQEKEKLRKNIDSITKAEFERAAKLRQVSSELSLKSERKAFEVQALKIEIAALEREINVKSEALRELGQKQEDLMAKRAVCQFRTKKLTDNLKDSKSHEDDAQAADINRQLGMLADASNKISEVYSVLHRSFENLDCAVAKSIGSLFDLHAKLKSYS